MIQESKCWVFTWRKGSQCLLKTFILSCHSSQGMTNVPHVYCRWSDIKNPGKLVVYNNRIRLTWDTIQPLRRRRRASLCDNTDKLRRQRARWSKPGRDSDLLVSIICGIYCQADSEAAREGEVGRPGQGHKVSALRGEKSSQVWGQSMGIITATLWTCNVLVVWHILTPQNGRGKEESKWLSSGLYETVHDVC